MSTLQVIGIDLGKSNFHVYALASNPVASFKKLFTRKQLIEFLSLQSPTVVAFEACGGAHWLARKCQDMGHAAKLIPPQYVKPYVKTNKNGFVDAEVISDAATRHNMRFVSPKTENRKPKTENRKPKINRSL